MKDIVYKYDKALKEFTKRYISNSNVIGILACGSYVHSTLDKNSDLDVYIILSESEDRERGNTWVDGIEVEYFMNPVKQVEAYFLQEENMKSFPATAHMFANCLVVYKTSNLVDMLIGKAKEIINKTMPEMSKFEIENSKYHIDDIFKDLENTYVRKDIMSFIVISNYLAEACLNVIYRYYRIFKDKPKKMLTQLDIIDSEFCRLYKDTIYENNTDIKFIKSEKLSSYTENIIGGKRDKEWRLQGKCTY